MADSILNIGSKTIRLKDNGDGTFSIGAVMTGSEVAAGSVLIRGEATGGSATTIADTTKNFDTDLVKTKLVKILISGIEYLRTISSHTVDTLTVAKFKDAVAASCVIFPAYDYEVTAVVVAAGLAGNNYSVVVVKSDEANGNLAAALDGSVLTITLGVDADKALDPAKNTGTLIAAAVDALAEFTASVTGGDGSVAATVTGTYVFTGGADAVVPRTGDPYEILG